MYKTNLDSYYALYFAVIHSGMKQRSQAILPEIHICLAGLPEKLEECGAEATSARAYKTLFFYRNYDGSSAQKRQEGYGEGKDGIRDL